MTARAFKAEVSPTGVLKVELADGRLVEVVFDNEGMPHRGRSVTTATVDGYVVEVILPYAVNVIRKPGESE